MPVSQTMHKSEETYQKKNKSGKNK